MRITPWMFLCAGCPDATTKESGDTGTTTPAAASVAGQWAGTCSAVGPTTVDLIPTMLPTLDLVQTGLVVTGDAEVKTQDENGDYEQTLTGTVAGTIAGDALELTLTPAVTTTAGTITMSMTVSGAAMTGRIDISSLGTTTGAPHWDCTLDLVP